MGCAQKALHKNKLALACRLALIDAGEALKRARHDLDASAFSDRHARRWGRRRRQADDAVGVDSVHERFDLAIRTAGGAIAEADEAEHAEGCFDRAPPVEHADEKIRAKEGLRRAPDFDLREEYFEAAFRQALGREPFTLRMGLSDRPIWLWHGRGTERESRILARGAAGASGAAALFRPAAAAELLAALPQRGLRSQAP